MLAVDDDDEYNLLLILSDSLKTIVVLSPQSDALS